MLDENQQIRFTRLWTDAQPTVSQFVASLVKDPWAVRDIVQNVSLVLLRKFAEYDESKPFRPWALGVAKFEILGHRRDTARDRVICDSVFLDQYTQAWAEVAPRSIRAPASDRVIGPSGMQLLPIWPGDRHPPINVLNWTSSSYSTEKS